MNCGLISQIMNESHCISLNRIKRSFVQSLNLSQTWVFTWVFTESDTVEVKSMNSSRTPSLVTGMEPIGLMCCWGVTYGGPEGSDRGLQYVSIVGSGVSGHRASLLGFWSGAGRSSTGTPWSLKQPLWAVGRVPNLLENEISIPIKLVRRKHEGSTINSHGRQLRWPLTW